MANYALILTTLFIMAGSLLFALFMNSFLKRVHKSKGETKFEGEFELFKLFKFKFKAKRKNNKK